MVPVLETVVEVVIRVLEVGGLPGLFALMAVESFGIPPLPSEVILPFAGFMVADGLFSFPSALAVALAGGLVGALAAYAVGRWCRDRLLGLGVGRWRLEKRHLDLVDRWFDRHGESTVALCRMVPVIRGYISYPAGTARMSPARFGIYTTLGSAPFAAALIYAGFLLRSSWGLVAANWGFLDYVAIAVVGLALVLWLLPTRLRGRSARNRARGA